MRLNHILPKLISKSYIFSINAKSTLPSIWSLTILFIIAIIGLTLSLIWRYYGIDWRSQLVERYAIVVSLDKEEVIYEESIKQRLAILLSDSEISESYEILKPNEIKNQLQDAFSELPDKYNYSLPIIVYIHGLKIDLETLQKKIKSIHKNARIEDSGEWVDSIRLIADFFYNIGGLLPWIIVILIFPALFTNVLTLVNSQLNCIKHMQMLGTDETKIKILLARYSMQWSILAMLIAIALFSIGLTILLFFQPLILPGIAQQELINNGPIVIGILIPIFSIFSWGIGWWQTRNLIQLM